MGTMAERLDELLSDAAYSDDVESSGLSAEAYYLQNTWDDDLLNGNAPNPDEILQVLAGLDSSELISVVSSLDVSQLEELDSIEDFDLAETLASLDSTLLDAMGIFDKMAGDVDFFQGIFSPDEMLFMLGGAGDMLADIVRGMDASNLAFLDGAEGFDLGATLAGLDPDMLGGFMSGWGGGELAFLGDLEGFDLGATMAEFDPEIMASMLGSWDDPSAISFLGGLDGFDFGAMLNDMPDNLKGEMLGHMDGSVLAGLGDLGGDFDLTVFAADAGDFLPDGFDLDTAMDSGDLGSGDMGGGDMGGDDMGGGVTVVGVVDTSML